MQRLPVCYRCGREMRCAENGVQLKRAFSYVRCDRFECPECGESVLVNFANKSTPQPSPDGEIVELIA